MGTKLDYCYANQAQIWNPYIKNLKKPEFTVGKT